MAKTIELTLTFEEKDSDDVNETLQRMFETLSMDGIRYTSSVYSREAFDHEAKTFGEVYEETEETICHEPPASCGNCPDCKGGKE